MGLKRKNKVVERQTLNEKEFNFANLVLSGKTPKDAAIECGYSNKSLQTAVWRLMQNPRVAAYIDAEKKRLEAVRRQAVEVDDIWITEKFKQIIETCTKKRPVISFTPEGEMVHLRNEQGEHLYEYVDSMAAIKAAENLAKHIGYFEADNRQRQTVIKVTAVQNNVLNYFEIDEEENPVIGEIEDTTAGD